MAAKQELNRIASYFSTFTNSSTSHPISVVGENSIPVLKAANGSVIKGLVSASKYLTRESKELHFLGADQIETAIVNQWLEYRTAHLDKCQNTEKDLHSTLKELNGYLADKVYFADHHMTLADVLIYYGLHPIYDHLSFYEKQQYMNLSRWFDNVQNIAGIRQDLAFIHFQRNIIYSKGSSH